MTLADVVKRQQAEIKALREQFVKMIEIAEGLQKEFSLLTEKVNIHYTLLVGIVKEQKELKGEIKTLKMNVRDLGRLQERQKEEIGFFSSTSPAGMVH